MTNNKRQFTGIEFKEIFGNNFYAIKNKEPVIGVNISEYFDPFGPLKNCDGIYFADILHICSSIQNKSVFICTVNILDDSLIIIRNKGFYANKIYISKIDHLFDSFLFDTEEKCIDAIEKNVESLYFIKNKTQKMVTKAIERGYDLKCVPEQYKTKEICIIALENSYSALEFLPEQHKTELYKISVAKCGRILELVPKEYKTFELCKIACMSDYHALTFIPDQHKTEEIYKIACAQDGYALKMIPEQYKTEEIYKIACAQNGSCIIYVPEQYKTEELCKIACAQNCSCIIYVPKEYKQKWFSV